MKHILLLISAVSLLASAGCIFPGHRSHGEFREQGEYRGHPEYREHTEYRSPPEPGVTVRIHAD